MQNQFDIRFTQLKKEHFPLLLKWLEAPHVKLWWDQEIKYTIEEVIDKYGSYVEGYKEVDGFPIGYIQLYNFYDFPRSKPAEGLPKNLGAFDVFIGEPDFTKKGIGSLAISNPRIVLLKLAEYSRQEI